MSELVPEWDSHGRPTGRMVRDTSRQQTDNRPWVSNGTERLR